MSVPGRQVASRTPARRGHPARQGKAPARQGRTAGSKAKAPARGTPRRPPRRGRRALRVARPKRPGRLSFVLVSFVIVGSLIAGVAGLQAVVSQTSFRMDQLANRAAMLQERNGELRLEVAKLSSPGELRAAARRNGLELPGPPVLLRVPPARAADRARQPGGTSSSSRSVAAGAP